MTKGVDERINVVFPWFGHVEGMKNDMFAKILYVGERAGSRSVGNPRRRWIDTVNDCLRKKKGLDVRQERRMVQDKSVLPG